MAGSRDRHRLSSRGAEVVRVTDTAYSVSMQALRPLGLAFALVFVASLVNGAAAAPEQTTPRLTLNRASVAATWREGWLKGRIRFSGTVGVPAHLVAVLRRVSGETLPRALDFTARRAGPFRAELRLPARPLPGLYRLQLTGSSDAGPLPRVGRSVTVPAPAEGVVDRAIGSVRPGGPPVHVVSGPRQTLFARFHFLVRPRAQRVQIVWRTPRYEIFAARRVPYTPTVYSRVRSSGEPLQRGVWYCLLMVGETVAKRLAIRIR